MQIPGGKHFCLYALAMIPLLPAKMRALDEHDWLAQGSLVVCPDPDERLVMKISRTKTVSLRAEDLT